MRARLADRQRCHLHATGTAGVQRHVDFVHARVQQRRDHRRHRLTIGHTLRPRCLGQRQQSVDRQHRKAALATRALRAVGQPLRHGAGGAQAGEGARPLAEGHGVDLVHRVLAAVQRDAAQDEGRHRVALLVPLSGANAEVGQAIANAAQMALLDSNSDALRITTYDTASGVTGATNRALADPELRKTWQEQGYDLWPGKPEVLAAQAARIAAPQRPPTALAVASTSSGRSRLPPSRTP